MIKITLEGEQRFSALRCYRKEIWVNHAKPETKKVIHDVDRPSSSTAKELKATASARKIMATVVRDSTGVVFADFPDRDGSVTAGS
jgi:hypothetical protein